MKTRLFDYQKEGVAAMHKHGGRFFLADEMGLGKSIQALAYAQESGSQRTLVVCPAGLKYNWQVEAARHFGIRAEVANGRNPPKTAVLQKYNPPILVINYDILHPWKEWINKHYRPDLVVADEVQCLGNPKSLRTRAIKTIVRRAEEFVALSGGPIENHTIAMWPVLNMLWGREFPSRVYFGERYCKPKMTPWGLEYRGICHAAELRKRLHNLGFLRRLQADVQKDLPPLTIQTVPLPVKKDPEYDRQLKELFKWYRSTRNATYVDGRLELERRARYNRLLQQAALSKMPLFFEWLADFLKSGEKIILFAKHRQMVDLLVKHLGGKAVKINGDVTGRKREQAKEKFTNDPDCQVLVGEHKSAGEGHTLTAARYVAFVELPWSPVLMRQCIKRIHRIGQCRPCHALIFLAEKTVEDKLCKLLKTKQHDIDAVIDGGPSAGIMDLFDSLDQMLWQKN